MKTGTVIGIIYAEDMDAPERNGRDMDAVLYIHGRGGSAAEAEHYQTLFAGCEVTGLDYRGDTPWDAGREINAAVTGLCARFDRVTLVANSIGAFFAMHAGINDAVKRAFFISPIVNMEKLISQMTAAAGVTEETLRQKGTVQTGPGETLSWDYLQFVRTHTINWDVPTCILYGSEDAFTSPADMADFAKKHAAELTVMEGGEHWFHTPEQMRFLDAWIRRNQ